MRFIGNGQAPVHKYWEQIMGYLQDGTFDTRFLVTHRVGLEDFPALYAAFDKRIVSRHCHMTIREARFLYGLVLICLLRLASTRSLLRLPSGESDSD